MIHGESKMVRGQNFDILSLFKNIQIINKNPIFLIFCQNFIFILYVMFLFLLGGCSLENIFERPYHDPLLQKEKKDYNELTKKSPFFQPPSRKKMTPAKTKAPSWPPAFEQPVSLIATEETPLQEILMGLAHQAHVNLALAPQIRSKEGVSYTARKVPFRVVVQNLCALAKLRYRFMGETLHIEEDTPYVKTYAVPFLLGTRQNQSRVSVMTDVFSDTTTKGAIDNGSNSLLTANTLTDFWAELENNLKLILSDQEPAHSLKKHAPPSSAGSYSFHKQAGLVSVRGTDGQHQAVEAYFKQLQNLVSTQIVIEAKIVEVSLNDEFKSGINWTLLKGHSSVATPLGSLTKGNTFNPAMLLEKNVFTMAFSDNGFAAIARFMEQFGTVRTLSNPRLTILNNQPALLKVAKNEVFFQVEVEHMYAAAEKPDSQTTTSQIQTIPIGLVMTVQPSVNTETEEITLNLRLTISAIVETRDDPSVAIQSQNTVQSSIPVVQVREMDSVVKILSGKTIVMGGLMKDSIHNIESKVPAVSDVPLLGSLFKSTEDQRSLTELVIFLRATLVKPDQQNVTGADRHFYESFTQDPRPLF